MTRTLLATFLTLALSACASAPPTSLGSTGSHIESESTTDDETNEKTDEPTPVKPSSPMSNTASASTYAPSTDPLPHAGDDDDDDDDDDADADHDTDDEHGDDDDDDDDDCEDCDD